MRKVLNFVRYWGFLLLKLAAAAAGSVISLWILNLFWEPYTPLFHFNKRQFSYELGYTTLVGVWFIMSYGLFYLAIWDQRYRCRTCLRRLMMPVEVGSWSYMLQIGRPEMQYICPFGHGKLNVAELQISGKEAPEWKQQGDIWEELFATQDASRDKDSDYRR